MALFVLCNACSYTGVGPGFQGGGGVFWDTKKLYRFTKFNIKSSIDTFGFKGFILTPYIKVWTETKLSKDGNTKNKDF